MASVFTRRFLFDPGSNVLLNIESVNILDLEPPSAIAGIGAGTVLLVGEFENGPFNTPQEVTGPTDLQNTWGTLGYTYFGVQGNNPCAVSRRADSAVTPEFWNGNGFVQLNAKQFARLLLCRVDSSVGSVQFTPQAFVTGAAQFRYTLSPGQTIAIDLGPTGTYSTATFSATAAQVTGAGFVGGMANGDSVTLGFDGVGNFTVFFQSTDAAIAQVVARINQFAGFAFAANAGGQVQLTSVQLGTGAQVRVVSASAGVLVKLGLTVTTAFGTGNVANIAAVTPQEIKSIIQAAVANTLVETDSQGRLRISNTVAGGNNTILIGAVTAAALGFTQGQTAIASYQADVVGTTYGPAVVGTLTLGFDTGPNFNVAVANGELIAALVTAINTAAGFTAAFSDGGATQLRLIGTKADGTGQIRISGTAATLVSIGLTAGTFNAAPVLPGILPAGTLVTTATGTNFVTMQDVVFGATGITIGGTQVPFGGPYVVKIRFAQDDGSGLAVLAGTIVTVTNPPDIGSFSVINITPTTNALTEPQLDSQYVLALASTLDVNSVAKQANIIYSARQSNQVRKSIRQNALDASANGCFGRMALVRTPLGTTKQTAQSTIAEPGVGAYRDQRVVYCYPQANTFVPIIANRGLSGGPGFTPTGNVDVGADGFLASIMSQLPPEENPGQLTSFTGGVNGLETSPNAQGFTILDYEAFKAAGICALRIDAGTAFFQSGSRRSTRTCSPAWSASAAVAWRTSCRTRSRCA